MQEPSATGGRALARTWWRAVPLVLLVAAAFWLRLRLAAGVPAIENDGAFYGRLAQQFLLRIGAGGFHPAWPDFYPRLTALAARWIFSPVVDHPDALVDPARIEFAARAVSAAFGALLLLPVFLVARRLAGGMAAWYAALLSAVHPRLLVFSAQALTEMTFGALVTMALALTGAIGATRSRRAVVPAAAGAGLLAGAAMNTRPEGIIAGVIVTAAAAWLARRHRLARWAGLVAGLAFALAALPRVVAVTRVVGHPTLSAKGDYNLALDYAGTPGVPVVDMPASIYNNLPGATATTPGFPAAIPTVSFPRIVTNRPLAVMSHVARNLPRSFGGLLSLAGWPWLLLAAVGLASRRRRLTAEEASWLGLWLGFVATYALAHVFRRFFVAALPLVMIEAGIGLAVVAGPAMHSRSAGPRRGLAMALLVVATVHGLTAAPRLLAGETTPAGQKELGHAIPPAGAGAGAGPAGNPWRERLTGPGVMARRPVAAWYAGRPILALPDAPPDSLAALARGRGAGFVLLIESDLPRTGGRLRPLLRGPDPAGLATLAADSTAADPWRIFRVE